MSLSDFDRLLAESAIQHGFCTREQITDGIDAQAKQALEGRPYFLGQILIKQRWLTANQYLKIENSLERKVYECESCRTRYNAKEVGKDGGLTCRGCQQRVAIEVGLDSLTEVEVMASRDPAELAVPLRVVGSSTRSERTSSRQRRGVSAGAKPALKAGAQRGASGRQRLTRAEREAQKNQIAAEARDQLADLSHYEIIDEIGRGGMGVVFKARHKDMDRLVAIKVVKSGPHISEKQLVRFVREGRAAARLNHPGIIRVFDIGTHRDFFYLAMEFVDGRSLHQVMRSDGISRRRAFQIMDQLLDAVAFAHSHDIIHRDLKPQNVVVDEAGDGGVRLIDFGLAKGGDPGGGSLTQTGQVIGTVFYLSPEQTRGESREADGRSDIFALGVIFYEMLTGVRPFEGRSAAEVYSKILKVDPVPPSSHQAGIDREIDTICLKALKKDAAKRFQSAEEFRDALRVYRDRHDVPDSLPLPVRPDTPSAGNGKQPALAGVATAGTSPSGRQVPRVSSHRAGRSGGSGRHPHPSGRHGLTGATVAGRSRVGGAGGSSVKGPGLVLVALAVAVVGALLLSMGNRPEESSEVRASGAGGEAGAVVTAAAVGDQPEPQTAEVFEPPVEPPVGRNGTTAQASLEDVRAYALGSPEAFDEIRYRFQELIDRFEGTASTVPEEARLEILTLDSRIARELLKACEVIQGLTLDGRYRDAMDEISAGRERFGEVHSVVRLDDLDQEVVEAANTQLATAREAVAKALETRDTDLAEALLRKLLSCGLPMVEGNAAEQQKTLAAARDRWRLESRADAKEFLKEFQEQIDAVATLLLQRMYRNASIELQKLSENLTQAEKPRQAQSIQRKLSHLVVATKGLERFFARTRDNLVAHYKDTPFQAANVSGRVLQADEFGLVDLQIGSGTMQIELTSKKEVTGQQLMAVYQRAPSPKLQDASLERICFSVLEGLAVLEEDVDTLDKVARAVSGGLGLSGGDLVKGLRDSLGDRLLQPEEPTLAGGETASDGGAGRTTREGSSSNRGRTRASERRGGASRIKVSDKELTQLIPIQAGIFTMGSDIGEGDESPRRKVHLSSYAIGKYEVTNRTYAEFLSKLKGRKHSSRFCHPQEPRDKADHVPEYWDDPRWNGDIHPVVGVDWWDAFACARAFGCRLPTEAEWERSARVRGRDYLNFPWGNDWDFTRVNSMARWLGKATYSSGNQDEFDRLVRRRLEAGESMTMPVTELPEGRSPIGAHHMTGNVAEWCYDWYDPLYYFKATGAFGETNRNPTGPETGTERTWRGGSWARDLARSRAGTIVNLLRAPYRQSSTPDSRSYFIGFRLVQELE